MIIDGMKEWQEFDQSVSIYVLMDGVLYSFTRQIQCLLEKIEYLIIILNN